MSNKLEIKVLKDEIKTFKSSLNFAANENDKKEIEEHIGTLETAIKLLTGKGAKEPKNTKPTKVEKKELSTQEKNILKAYNYAKENNIPLEKTKGRFDAAMNAKFDKRKFPEYATAEVYETLMREQGEDAEIGGMPTKKGDIVKLKENEDVAKKHNVPVEKVNELMGKALEAEGKHVGLLEKGGGFNFKGESATPQPKYMGVKGDKVVIECSGKDPFKYHYLVNAVNFAMVDMFFNSEGAARAYADKKGLVIVKDFTNVTKKATGGSAGDGFNYRLLDRLRSDNEYFLGYGNRSERGLWAGNVHDQIAKMKELWNQLLVKPEWLSMEDILEYERKMTDPIVFKDFDVVDHENNIVKTISVTNSESKEEAKEEALGILKREFPDSWMHYKLRYAGAQTQLFKSGGKTKLIFEVGGGVPDNEVPVAKGREDWYSKIRQLFGEGGKSSIGGYSFRFLEKEKNNQDELSIQFEDGSGLTFSVTKNPNEKWTIAVTPWIEGEEIDEEKESGLMAVKVMNEKIVPLFEAYHKKEKGGGLEITRTWNERAQVLVGKKVRTTGYLTEEEAKDMGWDYSHRWKNCLVVEFTDGSYILGSRDDGGNDAGYFKLSGRLKEINSKTGSRFGINENENNLRKYLVNAVVADAKYMQPESAAAYGWSKRPLILTLFGKKEDGEVVVLTITPQRDTEGNNGGAIFGQTADNEDLGFPTI